MSFILLFFMLFGCYYLTMRSLGYGFLGVLFTGYISGVLRANDPGVATTFLFDCSVLGLYTGYASAHWSRLVAMANTPAGHFVLVIILWPALLTLVPMNSFLIQLVSLRATVWFVPVVLIASQLKPIDLVILSRGIAVLNLIALAGGIYIFIFGVEAVYPKNAVTSIIYMSRDVGGSEFYRIPSTFLNAHSYGGVMCLSLPFVLGRALGVGVPMYERVLCSAGTAAAAAGIVMCAARLPAIVFACSIIGTWIATRFSFKFGIATVLICIGGIVMALNNERFQRIMTLDDTEYVNERIRGSANAGFFEILIDYPAGAGMGSSAGTSIPFFLADSAPEAIGLENEYCRIAVDQGLPGLLLWMGFLAWVFSKPVSFTPRTSWEITMVMAYSFAIVSWLTAVIGTGVLSSVPGTVMLLTYMGLVIQYRSLKRV